MHSAIRPNPKRTFGKVLLASSVLIGGLVVGLAAPLAADVPSEADYAASAAKDDAGGYDPDPGGFGDGDTDASDDPPPVVINPIPVIQGSLYPDLVPNKPAANEVVVPIRKVDVGECSFRDAHKNNGWGWNPVTRQSCR